MSILPAIAEARLEALEDWEIADDIQAMFFDITS